MTDKAKIKQEMKIVLRALLLSAPMGLTAVEIERDYREAQGYGVPFRELGYNSTSDLVEDLKDVASCQWERGHAVFHGIADKTTKHIKSLVSKQNVDVRKCLKRRNALERQVVRSGRGGYSSGRGGYSSGRGGYSSGRGRSFSTSSSRYQPPYSKAPQGPQGYGPFGQGRRTNSYPGTGGRSQAPPARSQAPAAPKSSPAYLRMQLKSLLNSHPNGILNTHFDSIFSRKCGFPIDYAQLGYTGLEDLVRSLSAVISVERINEEKFRIYNRENFPQGPTSDNSSTAKPKPLMSALGLGSQDHRNEKALQDISKPPSLMSQPVPPLMSPPIPDGN